MTGRWGHFAEAGLLLMKEPARRRFEGGIACRQAHPGCGPCPGARSEQSTLTPNQSQILGLQLASGVLKTTLVEHDPSP